MHAHVPPFETLEWLSFPAAADRIGVDVAELHAAALDGQLPWTEVGGAPVVTLGAARTWADNRGREVS